MRLIDADDLLDTLEGYRYSKEREAYFTGNKSSGVTWNDAIRFIEKQPTYTGEFGRLDDAISNVAYILECLQCYKRIVEEGNCNTCKNKECTWQPKWGKQIRYNCPHFVGIDAKEDEE